mmetsp:Transcript_15461/g.18638  ORF Transcript_15461/g.18638 Transcript_15461/m.18638 type:complete len:80 (-) Transcript_15461:21-260(-)
MMSAISYFVDLQGGSNVVASGVQQIVPCPLQHVGVDLNPSTPPVVPGVGVGALVDATNLVFIAQIAESGESLDCCEIVV